MSNIDRGTQQISFRWKHPAKAQDFNHLLNGAVKPGLCNTLQLTNVDNVVTFPQFNIFIEPTDSDSSLLHIETLGQFSLEMTPASDEDYIYCSFTQAEEIENYLDFNITSVAGSSGIIPSNNKVVLGTATSISGVIQSISTSGQTKSLWDENWNVRFEQNVTIEGNISCSGILELNGYDQRSTPVGTIVARLPGYYGAAGNGGGFTSISLSLPPWWKDCDGSELNDSESPIFNGSGRYLPDLTDDRFLMGDITSKMGNTGGSNSTVTVPGHYHGMGTGADLNITSSGSHTHDPGDGSDAFSYRQSGGSWILDSSSGSFYYNFSATTSSANHTHASGNFSGRIGLVTGGEDGNATITTGGPSDNRPRYIACRFIMRIK